MQSWLFGKALSALDADAVALHTSQGYETQHSKFLMRLTVTASDLLGTFDIDKAKPHLQADALTDEACCSLSPSSATVSKGFWQEEDTARAAVVALDGAATACSDSD